MHSQTCVRLQVLRDRLRTYMRSVEKQELGTLLFHGVSFASSFFGYLPVRQDIDSVTSARRSESFLLNVSCYFFHLNQYLDSSP